MLPREPKTAAKLKREDRSAEVVVITRDKDISYAGCGLPYYVGGLIESRDELIVNTPQKYAGLTGVEVRTGKEAVALNADKKELTVRDVENGAEEICAYDRLVLAVGASPAVLPLEGTDKAGVFQMRTPDDAIAIRSYVEEKGGKKAVVIGAGFIGLEAAENLKAKGVQVTVIDFASQILPNILDGGNGRIAHYYPDAGFFITKLIADKTTHRKLLGVQVFGPGAVDKMVDIAVMGINMGCCPGGF